MEDEERILRAILKKMKRLGYIGGRHTSVENLSHGFPGHLKGEVRQVIDRLLKSGWLIVKPKPDAPHVSLNPRFMPEIMDLTGPKHLNN